MNKRTILIIDDEAKERLEVYKSIIAKSRILSGENEPICYDLKVTNPKRIIEEAHKSSLILLDIFLDNSSDPYTINYDGNDVNILNELDRQDVKTPVFLASSAWGKEQFTTYSKSLANKTVQGTINFAPQIVNQPEYQALCATEIDAAIIRSEGGVYLNLDPSDDFHILHLSDLQFGGRWACGDSMDDDIQTQMITTIVNQVHKMQKGENFKAPLALAVTGDIAQTGSLKEYQAAERFLIQLLDKTDISREACFLCPGNHDVHIPSAESVFLEFTPPSEKSQSLVEKKVERVDQNFPHIDRGLFNFRLFTESLTGKSEWRLNFKHLTQHEGNIFFKSYLFAHYGINFFGLNTPNNIGSSPKTFTSGEVNTSSAQQFGECLKSSAIHYKHNLNIILSHHPIIKDSGQENNDIYTQIPVHSKTLCLFGHRHKTMHDQTSANQERGKAGYIYSCAPTLTLEPTTRPHHASTGFSSIVVKRENGIPNKVIINSFSQIDNFSFNQCEDNTYNL